MSNETLFIILGSIPESLVLSYKIEYVNDKLIDDKLTQKFIVKDFKRREELFLRFYRNRDVDILKCYIYFDRDSFIEVDSLSKSIYFKNVYLQFPFLDELIKKKLLGKNCEFNHIQWI